MGSEMCIRDRVAHRGKQYPGQHAAIIDAAQFDMVQAVFAAHKEKRETRRPKMPSSGGERETAALTGFIFCGCCGSAMTPSMWAQRALATIILRKRVPRSLFVAHAEEMERTLEHLYERYGTARAYLEAYAGVAPDVLDRLTARLRG